MQHLNFKFKKMENKKIIFIVLVAIISIFLLNTESRAKAQVCNGKCVNSEMSCSGQNVSVDPNGTNCSPNVCCVPESGSQGYCAGTCVPSEAACSGTNVEVDPLGTFCDPEICCVTQNTNNGTCSGECVPSITLCSGTIDPNGTNCGSSFCCVTTSPLVTPSNNQTTMPTANSTDIPFPNPIKASTMSEFLGNVLDALLGVVAFISLIFIIIGAVMYMVSAGNEQAIERAKKTITGAVVGLAIAAAAPTFLKEIKKILGGASGTNADDIVNKAYTLKDIAINVLNFLLSVTGIVAIIGLIVGAIFYLTSYGDEDRMGKGKKILVASIIGIVIAFASLVIVRQVANLIAAQ